MKLIIAEKPDLAKAIAGAIEGKQEIRDGYLKKGEYYITWAFGHLFELKSPELYDIKYKKWLLEDLPINFPDWEIKEIDSKKKQVKIIETLIKNKEVTEIINAGDPDDEGQLLIDEILRFFKNKKQVLRVLINDMTKESVKKAISNLKNNSDYENLGKSAYARSVADFMIGINLSRFFSIKNFNKLYVGRVQTPTLAMIVNRDNSITNHVKEKYYEFYMEIEIDKTGNKESTEELFKLHKKYEQAFHNYEKKEEILEKISQSIKTLGKEKIKFKLKIENDHKLSYEEVLSLKETDFLVTSLKIDKTIKKEWPPLPFNLAKLQIECSNKFNYSPSEVMEITQVLREKYKAISYNRSDCEYLSEEQYVESPNIIPVVLDNLQISVPEINYLPKPKSFDDAKITAHTGIIPTKSHLDLSTLSEKERSVYILISNRYIVQFLRPLIKEITEANLSYLKDNDFKATSSRILDLGYKSFLREKEEEEEALSSEPLLNTFVSGEYLLNKILDKKIEEKETKPLKPYTEATLIEDMTSISKYVKDEEMKKLLKEKDKDKKGENGSIGTPATRSNIIKNLFDRGYIEKDGKKVIATRLGKEYISILPDILTTPEMTARWYLLQEEIKETGNERILINSVLETIKDIISKDYKLLQKSHQEKEIIGKCPICSGDIYIGKTKDGKLNYYCSNYKEKKCPFSLKEEMKHFDNTLRITKVKAKALLKKDGKVKFKLTYKDKEYLQDLKIKINEVNGKKFVNFEKA